MCVPALAAAGGGAAGGMTLSSLLPSLLGVGLSMAGSMMEANSRNAAIRQQQSYLTQALQNQAGTQDRINQTVMDSLPHHEPEAIRQRSTERAGEIQDNLHEYLQGAQASRPSGDVRGKVSDAYTSEAANYLLKEAEDAATRAHWSAANLAPSFVRFDALLDQNRVGNEIDKLRLFGGGNAAVDHLRVAGVQPKTPWLAYAMQGIGKPLAAKGLGDIFAGGGAGLDHAGMYGQFPGAR